MILLTEAQNALKLLIKTISVCGPAWLGQKLSG
jgi:hypothetical protein